MSADINPSQNLPSDPTAQPSGETSDSIAIRIKMLGSKRREERESAEQALQRVGAGAISALLKVIKQEKGARAFNFWMYFVVCLVALVLQLEK